MFLSSSSLPKSYFSAREDFPIPVSPILVNLLKNVHQTQYPASRGYIFRGVSWLAFSHANPNCENVASARWVQIQLLIV